jgi:hypothetical protein
MDPNYQLSADDVPSRNGSVQFQTSPGMTTPPRIFGAYHPDGSPVTPTLPGPIFSSEQEAEDANNEAKRRRIAKVDASAPFTTSKLTLFLCRRAICAVGRRSNAMGNYRRARIV